MEGSQKCWRCSRMSRPRVANAPAFVRSSQSLQAVKPAERSGVLLSFSAVFCQTTAKEKMNDRGSHPAIKHSNIRHTFDGRNPALPGMYKIF